MKNYLLFGLLLGLVGMVSAELIEIGSQGYRIAYRVDEKGALHLESVGSTDGQWVSPLKGPMFVSTPFHGGNGPRYQGPFGRCL